LLGPEEWQARGSESAAPRAGPRGFDILHPNDWDIFYVDPSRPAAFQTLGFSATAPARWFVDGEEVAGRWPLRRGTHDLTAVGPGGESARRRFRVE
ncbi:MAG: hypothetical protein HYY17_02145, partial [Planctomycetes bacterium]|nr:hypothetical protein [Planctomycetota bacterium]